jgi:hypothetical protein
VNDNTSKNEDIDFCCVKGCNKKASISNGKLQFCRKHAYAVEWYHKRTPYEIEYDRRAERIAPILNDIQKSLSVHAQPKTEAPSQ